MVSRRFLGALWLAGFISIAFIGTAKAQWHYHLEQEWAKIWINPDGTIDLLYNVSITQELDS